MQFVPKQQICSKEHPRMIKLYRLDLSEAVQWVAQGEDTLVHESHVLRPVREAL